MERAAPPRGVTVHLGEHDAGDAQLLVEGIGHRDGILTRHGVRHEENLLRREGGLEGRQFVHQGFIDVQTACGVEQYGGALLLFRVGEGRTDDVQRLHVRRGLIIWYIELSGQRHELVDGRRAVYVDRHEIRTHLALAQQVGDLGGRGGLTRTLQAHHHDHTGLCPAQVEFGGAAAQKFDKLVVDDLDDLLCRGEALEYVLSEAAFLDPIDEILDDLEIDVGLQQGETHFAQAFLDVVLVELALSAEFAERLRKSVG